MRPAIKQCINYSLITWSAVIIYLSACTNPFTTRDIEEPEINKNSDIFDQPIASDIVLNNFRFALIQKNISNYMNCLADPSQEYDFLFRFIPDPSIEMEKFIGWNLNDERTYLNTVFKQATNISLEFLEGISFTNISQSPDSVQTNSIKYELRISFENEEILYSGLMRMKLTKNANAIWAIYYWEDTKTSNSEARSWSNLKANYKN
jgi:hypothetical protein